jgi:hypothetical protein
VQFADDHQLHIVDRVACPPIAVDQTGGQQLTDGLLNKANVRGQD